MAGLVKGIRARWFLFTNLGWLAFVGQRGLLGWVAWPCYRVARFFQGAKPVKAGGLEDTHGELDLPGLAIRWSGACPVQGEGTVDGLPCYYRSRGEGWQFHVGPTPGCDPLDQDGWVYQEDPYVWPDGGWVPSSVSRACILKAVGLYREQRRAGLG